MKNTPYTAPTSEQMELALDSHFLTESNLAPASTVETADYHGNEAW